MMTRIIVLLVAWCVALVALTGCGSTDAASGNIQTKTVDGLTIALEAPPAPKLLDQATFTITLTDATGKPIDGADVYVEMVMTTMPMGSNKPVANAAGSGKYTAQGTFDMTGDWNLTVHANVQGKDHAALFTSKVEAK